MKDVIIVILDSGIEKSHKIFQDIDIQEYIYCEESNKWEVMEMPVKNGHGTAIASAIVKNTDIKKLISFRVTDDEDADVCRLTSALEYIDMYIECDLINVSMGVDYHNPDLESVCISLKKKEIVIVSAFANEGGVSYPAAYDSVIGVDTTENVKSFKEFIYVENSIVNVGCMHGVQRLAWLNGEYQLVIGTSFAAPLITARIASYFLKGMEFYDINRVLANDAVCVMNGRFDVESKDEQGVLPFRIRRAAIFPYNKETMNVIRFHNMLNFELVKVYDSRYSGNVGLKLKDSGFAIEDIIQCSYDEIDTFIIGHTDIIKKLTNRNFKREIISKCIEKGIQVVSFDAEDIDNEDKNEKIYIPSIARTQATTDKFGKLYSISSPVLGIVGTASQQGKFTLQLKLRKLFQEEGYCISQLSSEPEGCLFGMDYIYPYGYNSNVSLQGIECIEHVNALMHKMDIGNPDIILFGAQSGACVLSFDNTIMYNVSTTNFLLGANPDAVIMCANYHDEVEDIARAIKFVESLVDCKVIGISLFPLAFVNKWNFMRNVKDRIEDGELIKRADYLENELGIHVYVLGKEADERHLFDTVIDFFQSNVQEEYHGI